jgi:hypothetical protein
VLDGSAFFVKFDGQFREEEVFRACGVVLEVRFAGLKVKSAG